jgi:hypothetical protein
MKIAGEVWRHGVPAELGVGRRMPIHPDRRVTVPLGSSATGAQKVLPSEGSV